MVMQENMFKKRDESAILKIFVILDNGCFYSGVQYNGLSSEPSTTSAMFLNETLMGKLN